MDKRRSLADAVSAVVRPGQALHFSFTHNRSHALAFEVARQFAGSRSLDLIASGLLDYAIVLEGAEALRSASSAFAGMTYPAAGPSPPMRVLAERDGSDPDWTNLTVTLRLMAGALGMPAIPTSSLAGTSLADGAGRAEVENPFDGTPMTVLSPLRADVAFLHAPVADWEGNVLVQGPSGEDLWGAWGAERVIVSAERVVSPAQLRAMTPGPGLPASRVSAVVEAPFGAHPQAQFVWDPRLQVQPYAEDYAFRDDLRAAARDPQALASWLRQWVLDTDHAGYLDRLGNARLDALRRAVSTPVVARPAAGETPAHSPSERAAAIGVRWLREHLGRSPLPQRPLFAGIGLSHLVAFAAARQAADDGNPVQLVAEVGMMGFDPPDGDPYIFSAANAASAVVHADFVRMLAGVGGRAGLGTVAVLSAGEIDGHGRLNSSRSSDGSFIVGSGGANDLTAGDADLLVVVPLSPRRAVAELPFVTAAPQRLRAVATDHGVLEPGPDGALRLSAVVAPDDDAVAAAVDAAREQCGFKLTTSPDVRRLEPPSAAEVAALRALDPHRRLLR